MERDSQRQVGVNEALLRNVNEAIERGHWPGEEAPIAFRVNPDVAAETHPYIATGMREHKFGVPIAEAGRLYGLASANRALRVRGVSVHIGSQITRPEPFADALARVAALVRQLRLAGHEISFVDAGGGLGISYGQDGTDPESRGRGPGLRDVLRRQ